MMKNATFERALSLLAGPFGLVMLALLLANDHVLRRVAPSWWTGKLGDVAWLGFFPFALAALLAWAIPMREPARQRWVRNLAFGLTGSVFALAKTLPAAHTLVVDGFETIFRIPSTLVRDPSDLLALPVLWLGWHLWNQAASPAATSAQISLRLAVLPVAALLTIANSAAPDYGIVCIESSGGGVSAHAAYSGYRSSDGGLSWSADSTATFSGGQCPGYWGSTSSEWQQVTVQASGEIFRYRSGDEIEASTDGGQTWQTAFTLPLRSEAIQAYVVKTASFNPVYRAGPFQAVEDPSTGNLIFAMGHEGALVRTASGEWRPAAVGPYSPLPTMPDFAMLQALLGDQLILALLASLVIYAILAVPRVRLSKKWLYGILWFLVVLGGLAWLAVVLLFPPALSGYGYALVAMALLAAAFLLVPLVLALSIDLFRNPTRRSIIPKMALAGLAGAVVFFLPSLLWAYNLLPAGWTVGLSIIFVASVTGYALWKLGAASPLNS